MMKAILNKMRQYGLQTVCRGGFILANGKYHVSVDWTDANIICHHARVIYKGNAAVNGVPYALFSARAEWASFRFAVKIKGEA
jgi:hypothetical protein